MRSITLEELLEAGCHFGHQVTRFNPKARDFVFEARDNIHIIDLEKTREGLLEASDFVKDLAKQGKTLLIVGTKRQAKDIILKELERVKGTVPFYVTSKWIGGTLTNFPQIQKNLKKLEDLEEKLKNEEEKTKYTKKEIGLWDKERQRLLDLYGGVREMKDMPSALFIVDSHLEELAVKEANRMNIQTVAITDTNSDPTLIDYPIPANDDAVGSIQLIVSYIIDAWIEGVNEKSKIKVQKEIKEEVKDGKGKPRKSKKA